MGSGWLKISERDLKTSLSLLIYKIMHIPKIEIEELEGAITNLESPRPQQYQTGLLRSLLTKLKRMEALQETYTDLLDHIGNNYEAKEYQLIASPENVKFAEAAETLAYGKNRSPLHIDGDNFIWTTDLVLLDYLAHCLENGISICSADVKKQ